LRRRAVANADDMASADPTFYHV